MILQFCRLCGYRIRLCVIPRLERRLICGKLFVIGLQGYGVCIGAGGIRGVVNGMVAAHGVCAAAYRALRRGGRDGCRNLCSHFFYVCFEHISSLFDIAAYDVLDLYAVYAKALIERVVFEDDL